MKLSDSEAHVSLGRDAVLPGDQVIVYRNVCQPRTASRKGSRVKCEKRRIGEGRITEILSEDYSVMEAPAEVHFQVGDLVESIGH